MLQVLSFLAAAYAAPQGYSYQQQQNRFALGSSGSGSRTSVSDTILQHGFLQDALQNNQLQQTLLGGGGGQHHSVQQTNHFQRPAQQQTFGFNTQPQQHQQHQQNFQANFGGHQQQNYNRVAAPVITKDIYVHVAPEEPEEKFAAPVQAPIAPARKHYRIVFIKAPTPSVSSQAIQLRQAPTEEKTIIYVLTKKPDPLDLQAAFQDVQPKQPSKPEVYFIKYKTQEEAQHAQRTIQGECFKLDH